MLRKCIQKVISVVCLFAILALPVTLRVEAIATTEVGSYLNTGRFYVIQNVRSGKFLEVANGNLTSGTNVWQDTFNLDSNMAQVFSLVLATSNGQPVTINGRYYYQFVPACNTDICLDVDNAYDADGTNVKVFAQNANNGAQYFTLIQKTDNSFCIQPYVCSDSKRVLTVVNNSTSNQANVELSTFDKENSSQRWVFKEINPLYDVEYINQNWDYFFRGTAGTDYRFISQRMNLSSSNWHNGTDIPASVDTAIYSPFEGEVIAMRRLSAGQAEGTMGNYVIIRSNQTIDTSDGEKTLTVRMMHMNSIPSAIAVGVVVDSNDIIGRVGSTGNSTGNHLHLDVNTEEYKRGDDFLSDPDSLINPEKFYLSKRFRYDDPDARIFATDVVY